MDDSHTSTSQASAAEPYTCTKCGYAGKGVSVAVESATVYRGGTVLGLFGNERAAEMARDSADAKAWAEVLSDVEMASCPRCASVNRLAWIAWLARPEYFLSAVIGGITFLTGGVLCAATFTATNLFSVICAAVGGVFFLVAGPLMAILPLTNKRQRTKRVHFDPAR